ncbi:hypothetical protein BHE74_00057341 [Ensete ventricosum]|nr:hypothetical protein BHE74_00057341 [Ensete ventricosum]
MIDYNQKISQSQAQTLGRSEDNAVGNSLGVHRELAEDIESLLGWHKGVHLKKTKTHLKMVKGSRKAFQDSCTVAAQVFGQLTVVEPPRTVVEPPRTMVEPLVPWF